MPVPVWGCSDLGLLDEPLDTATVVSDDIWKKFDLDLPLDLHPEIYHHDRYDDGVFWEFASYEDVRCRESREIRHHDCMWAGLCISKEHNRTLPAKRDSQVQKTVPAGRSLLISRATSNGSSFSSAGQTHSQHSLAYRSKNLESDGDSTRPETPQSTGSDTETEDEVPVFRHEQISIHEKLSECMSEAAATKAVPVSEVTGQLVRRFHERRKDEEGQCQVPKETNIRNNTLSDHCYHLNQPIGKNLEHLGVQTPEDSEEEIDVVTFEKPCRPAALPTYPSPADQQHFQLTVNTAFKDTTVPAPRPRGRPPSNPARKRNVQPEQRSAKRTRHRNYQRRGKVARCVAPSSPPTPVKLFPSTSRSSSDDELDTEKRSLHNNMERQRRIELRNAFEELRVLVPAVEAKEKAPKVAILRQAAVYCDMLNEMDQISVAQVMKLKKRQERLRARLSQLRRSLAMTR